MSKIHMQNELFWKKKVIISYVLSVLVFMIHISSFSQYAQGNSMISVINEKVCFFFTESITRFAVPMFFALSGIAFFRNYDNSLYYKKLKSRVKTLLIPYLAWNTIWMLFEIICSYSFLSTFYIGREKFDLTFINILKGIFFHKCTPFWFVFNLMVFMIFAPVINLVIKNKYVGFTSVLALSLLLIFNIGLPTWLFTYQDSIIYFLVGAIIGKHYFYNFEKKSALRVRVFSAGFLIAIIVLKNVFPYSFYTIKPFVTTVVYVLCAFSFWQLFDVIVDKLKVRPVYSRSFMVYAMHTNISAIITKLTMFILPKSEWFAIPNFIITTILTLVLINVFCIIIEQRFPLLCFLLSGKNNLLVKKSKVNAN